MVSGYLHVTKNTPNTVQDQWIEMLGLGHKKFSCKQNAAQVFPPEYHQYKTQVSLRRRARGAGDSWDMDAGCTLAMAVRGWIIPARQFSVVTWSSPEVLQVPLQ